MIIKTMNMECPEINCSLGDPSPDATREDSCCISVVAGRIWVREQRGGGRFRQIQQDKGRKGPVSVARIRRPLGAPGVSVINTNMLESRKKVQVFT